jgi:hypothetical protein
LRAVTLRTDAQDVCEVRVREGRFVCSKAFLVVNFVYTVAPLNKLCPRHQIPAWGRARVLLPFMPIDPLLDFKMTAGYKLRYHLKMFDFYIVLNIVLRTMNSIEVSGDQLS